MSAFVRARISQVENTDDGKSKVYIISCETQVPPITWAIRKRYSEFRELYTRVKKEARDLEMPSKKMGKLTDFELEQRRAGLDKFLGDVVQLLSTLSPQAYQAIWTFLELHKMQQDGDAMQREAGGGGSGPVNGAQNGDMFFDTPDRHKQLLANLDKGTITLEQYNILVESDRKAADASNEFSNANSRDDGQKDSDGAAKRKKQTEKADMKRKADQKMQAMKSMLDSTRLELAKAKEDNDSLRRDMSLKDQEMKEWEREIKRKDARIKVLSTELQDRAPIQLGDVLSEETVNEAGEDLTRFVQYTVHVQKGDRAWTVRKRYRSFFRFHRQLKKDCPVECRGVIFPWRKPFKLNGRAVESRMGRLERYLQVLLSRQSNNSWTATTILQQHIYEFLSVPEEWSQVLQGRNTGAGGVGAAGAGNIGAYPVSEDEDEEEDPFRKEDEEEFRRQASNPFA
jgi:hypothetical protein